MKNNRVSQLLVLGLAGVLASCSQGPETTTVSVSAPLRPDRSLSGEVFEEINSYRAQHGGKRLQRHPGLDRLAQRHSQYLLNNRGKSGLHGTTVSHDGFEGRAMFARASFKMAALSENVAAAHGASARYFVKLWGESRSHSHNMKSDWAYTGIGIAVAPDGTVFATQLFGSKPFSGHMEMTDRFRRF